MPSEEILLPPSWEDVEADAEFQALTPQQKAETLGNWAKAVRSYGDVTGAWEDPEAQRQFQESSRQKLLEIQGQIPPITGASAGLYGENPIAQAVGTTLDRANLGVQEFAPRTMAAADQLLSLATRFPEAITTPIDAVAGTDLTGQYQEFNQLGKGLAEMAMQETAKAQEISEAGKALGGGPDISLIGRPGDILQQVVPTGMQVIQDIALSGGAGTAQALQPAAKSALELIIRNATSPAMKRVAKIAGTQQGLGTLNQEMATRMGAGETLLDAQGNSVPEAALAGITTAVFTSLGGMTGAESVLKQSGVSGLKNRIKETLVEGFLKEAPEEAADQAGQQIASFISEEFDPTVEKKGSIASRLAAKVNVSELAQAGLLGGIVGGGVTAIGQATEAIQDRAIVQQASIQAENLRANAAPATAEAVEENAAKEIVERRIEAVTPEQQMAEAFDEIMAGETAEEVPTSTESADDQFAPTPAVVNETTESERQADLPLTDEQQAAKARVEESLIAGLEPDPEDVALAGASITTAQQAVQPVPQDTPVPAAPEPTGGTQTVLEGAAGEQDVGAYQAAQDEIDAIEARLEQDGVDIMKLYDPTVRGAEILKDSGWTPMPENLVQAYAKRNSIGANELQTNIDQVSSVLSGVGLSEAEVKRLLTKYALDGTSPEKQTLAATYSQQLVARDPLKQAEEISYALAAERGEKFDELRDVSDKTKKDAANAVKAIRSYFGLETNAPTEPLPTQPTAEAIPPEGTPTEQPPVGGEAPVAGVEAQPAQQQPITRVQLRVSPQTFRVVQKIPQTEGEKERGEQFFRVVNERTNEEQIVEAGDIAREVKPKSERVKKAIRKLPANQQAKAEAATEIDTTPDPYQGAPLTNAAPLPSPNLPLLQELSELGALDEDATGQKILQKIADGKYESWQKTLAKRLVALGTAMQVQVVNRPDSSWSALFVREPFPVTYINLARRNPGATLSILHEAAHDATLAQIRNPDNLTGEARKAYDDLVAIHKEISAMPEFQGEYGTTSVEEMVAEAFSNAGFRAKLDRIQSGTKTLWERFVNAITRLLFAKNAAYDSALHKIVENGFTLAGAPVIETPSNGSAAMAESDNWEDAVGNPNASNEAEAKAFVQMGEELSADPEITEGDITPLTPEQQALLTPSKTFNPIGLTVYWAKQFSNMRGTTTEDRIGMAKDGLIKAAKNYDPEKGIPFFSYANTVIKNNMINERDKQKTRSKYIQEDAPISDESDTETLISTAPSPADLTLQENDRNRMRRVAGEALQAVMDRASERDQGILTDYSKGESLRSVAATYNMSQEGVRKVLKRFRDQVEKALFLRGVTNIQEIIQPIDQETEPAIPSLRRGPDDEQALQEQAIGELEAGDIERSEPLYDDESTPEEMAEAIYAAENLPDVSEGGMVQQSAEAESRALQKVVDSYITGFWPDAPNQREAILRDQQDAWLRRDGIADFLRGTPVRVTRLPDDRPSQLRFDTTPIEIGIGGLSKSTLAATKGLSERQARTGVIQELNEELIHAAHIGFLRQNWERSGSQGGFEEYVGEYTKTTLEGIEDAVADMPVEDQQRIAEAIASSAQLYYGESLAGKTLPEVARMFYDADPAVQVQVIHEMIRQVVQLRKTGSITETSTINFLKAVKEWISNALKGLRWASRNIEKFGPEFAEQIRGTEALLASAFPRGPDQRTVAPMAERRSQIGGVENIGHQYETTSMKETIQSVRENVFDSTQDVSDTATEAAWNYIQALSDFTGNTANLIAGRVNTQTGTEAGTAALKVELLRYAVKIAAQSADRKMLNYLMASINLMPNSEMGAGESQAGLTLRVRAEFESPSLTAQKAFISQSDEVTAKMLTGRANNTDDIQFIKDLKETLQKFKLDGADVIEGIREMGEQKWEDLLSVLQKKGLPTPKRPSARGGAKTAVKTKSPDAIAEDMIEAFARTESDPQIWDTKKENAVRSIVKADLAQSPNMGRKQPWMSSLIQKLINAGVSESSAERLAERVWRQHEIKSMNRQMEIFDKAAENGPLYPIIEAILSTPLSEQSDPDWKKKVVIEYLRNSNLSTKDAESVAKLLSGAIDKRFRDAQVKAAEQAVRNYAPWKAREKREPRKAKSDLDKILAAVRSQALDPSKSFAEELAKQNGWTGFTDEQFKRMSELDAIIESESANLHEKTQARDELMAIVQRAKMEPRWRDTLGDYYVGMVLSGIPTMTINIVSPAAFTVQKAIVDGAAAIATNPARLPSVAQNFMASLDGWMEEVAFSYKNDSYTNDVNEALETNRALKRKLEGAFKKFSEAKTAPQKALATVQIAIGLADYTRRALSALDQGAITVSTQYNMGRYAMSALAQKGLNARQINDILTGVLSDKQRFYDQAMASGQTPQNAAVAANDHTRDVWAKVFSDYDIEGAEVLRAAQNDALSEVGRLGPKQEGTSERDEDKGVLTTPFFYINKALQTAGSKSPSTQILIRMIYGFFSVPARVIHYAAWYSPYGYVRVGADIISKKRGNEGRYGQSLATDIQMRQRLIDATAGTIVMALIWGLAKGSSDIEDEDKWAIVVTGNGPRKAADPAYFDAWHKNWKPWSITAIVNGTKVPLNFGRGFESLMFPLIPSAAADDYSIRFKQNEGKKTPADLNAISEIGGSVFSIIANRGPAAIVTRGLKVNPYSTGSDYASSVVGVAANAAKTMVPVFGSSLARNISDMFGMSIDRTSANGVIAANIPFAGQWLGRPALNFLGDPIGDQGFDQKLWRLGVPVVVSLPENSPNRKLYQLIFEKGQGPIVANRAAIERQIGETLTDAQWYNYAKTYGQKMAEYMNKEYGALSQMKPQQFNNRLNAYNGPASSFAIRTLPKEYQQKLQ